MKDCESALIFLSINKRIRIHVLYMVMSFIITPGQTWERKFWAYKLKSFTELTVGKPGLEKPQFVFQLHEPYQ